MPAYAAAAQSARKHIVKSLDPPSVSANAFAEGSFTVKGLKKNMGVFVWMAGAEDTNLYIVGARVIATDTLEILYYNNSGSTVNMAATDHHILAW